MLLINTSVATVKRNVRKIKYLQLIDSNYSDNSQRLLIISMRQMVTKISKCESELKQSTYIVKLKYSMKEIYQYNLP